MPGVAFFVCGTPSNNRGFEFVELGPERLPGTPEAYLDKAPSDAVECHRIESILIADQRYVEYSRVLRINPNDAQANRGAYIAVGCLIGQRVAFNAVSNCVDAVSELYGRVCSGLTPERSFPIGFRLTDFAHTGSALEERTAYQCSPLLVSDVVLQALNGEGPIDWATTRQVLLAPGEMIAADIRRYQLYSRQGLLGSLASIDLERAEVHQMARQTAMAAEALAEVQQEWEALQGAAARLLTKAEALGHLTEEMERSGKRDLSLGAAGTRDGRVADTDSASAVEEAGRVHERHYRKSAASNAAAFASHARVSRRGSVRSKNSRGHWLRGSRWASVPVLIFIGGLLALVAIVAFQQFLLPELADEAVPPAAVVIQPEQPAGEQHPDGEELPGGDEHPDGEQHADGQQHPDGEQELEQPQNDVVRERAALDALPDE